MRYPHIILWPPSMWFTSKHVSSVDWKPDMTPGEAAQVIERFIDGPGDSIEWCDFAETRQKDPRVESYRKRCDKLAERDGRSGGDRAKVDHSRVAIDEQR